MPKKQTSPELSTIAARYVRMTNDDIAGRARYTPKAFGRDVRKLAASCLGQDEVRGKRSAKAKGQK